MARGESKKGEKREAALLETLPAAVAPIPTQRIPTPGVGLEETALPDAIDPTIQGIDETQPAPIAELDKTDLPDGPAKVPPTSKSSDAAPSLARGDALGRYVVLDLLGKGGMGEVYSAYDPTLDRKVALKVLRPALSSGNSVTAARARLSHEAQAMAKLAHPNVIQVFDVGTVDGNVYVAMEFVDGLSLRDWLEKGQGVHETLDVFRSAALGLAAAHEAGLVHRDFKPDNVLIGSDGRVRVIDFGIASVGGTQEENADTIIEELARSTRKVAGGYTTLTGVAAGTPAYMAPEQFSALPCDARTDQFSFAIALYEAVYKERPFEGSKISELSNNVCEGNRRPLPATSAVPPWIPLALAKSLLPATGDRYESMHHLLRALTPPKSWLAKHRSLALATATIGAAAVLTLVLLPAGEHDKPCEIDGSLVSGVWDASRANALQEHFARSALPYAKDTATKIIEQLNTHTGSWQLARKNLCLAARRNDLSEDLKLRGVACLDRRLRELDAVGTILSGATDEIIKNAPIVASELSPIADCTNTTLLAASNDALPPEWQEIEDSFSELKALFNAAQHKELVARAKEVDRLALERGFALGHGEALNWLGSGERALAMYEPAEEHFFEAIRVGQKENSPRIRAVAWEGLMSLAGSNDQPKQGLRWYKHAVLANEQAGVDPELQARMTYLHGFLYYELQDYELALGRFQASAALYEKIFGPAHWRVSSNLSLASASLRQLGRFDEALETSKQAVEVAKASLGPDHPRMASIHNGAANTFGRVMRFDEAREHYREGLRLTRAIGGSRSAGVAMFLHNLALMELRVGDFKAALDLAEQALEMRKEFLGDGHPGVVRTLISSGTAHFRMGDLKRALEIQTDAVKRYQLINGDEHRATAEAQAALCDYLRRAKKYGEARAACSSALKFLDPGATDPRDLGRALTLSAWVDLAAGKKPVPLGPAERAWKLQEEHASEASSIGQGRYVVALALHALGRIEEAKDHAEAAKRLILAGDPGDDFDILEIEAFLTSLDR